MPWPLAAFCWLDNRSHEWHDDAMPFETSRTPCRVHDAVMLCWWRLLPRSEAKFNRKLTGTL